jgi:membrane protein involved in colicin uptake
MPRRSLRPNLNQIRAWARQGRTDAWMAHQLEVSVRDIEQFKRQNELVSDEASLDATIAADYPDEIDLRAEDDALIAAELEAAEIEAERVQAEADAERAKAQAEAERAKAEAEANAEHADDPEALEADTPPTRARRRRGGRARRVLADRSSSRNVGPLEGTFDHGEEGYGLWLDPAIQDNQIYAEHWAGHRPVEVDVEEDRIVIRRVGEDD